MARNDVYQRSRRAYNAGVRLAADYLGHMKRQIVRE